MPRELEPLLKSSDVARWLNLTQRGVQTLTERGVLPAVKIGSRVLGIGSLTLSSNSVGQPQDQHNEQARVPTSTVELNLSKIEAPIVSRYECVRIQWDSAALSDTLTHLRRDRARRQRDINADTREAFRENKEVQG